MMSRLSVKYLVFLVVFLFSVKIVRADLLYQCDYTGSLNYVIQNTSIHFQPLSTSTKLVSDVVMKFKNISTTATSSVILCLSSATNYCSMTSQSCITGTENTIYLAPNQTKIATTTYSPAVDVSAVSNLSVSLKLGIDDYDHRVAYADGYGCESLYPHRLIGGITFYNCTRDTYRPYTARVYGSTSTPPVVGFSPSVLVVSQFFVVMVFLLFLFFLFFLIFI